MNGLVLIGLLLSLLFLFLVISWLVYLVERIELNGMVRLVRNGVFGCLRMKCI